MFIYLFIVCMRGLGEGAERERERERGERQSQAGSTLSVQSPTRGSISQTHETVTWAEMKSWGQSTDWATQVPLQSSFLMYFAYAFCSLCLPHFFHGLSWPLQMSLLPPPHPRQEVCIHVALQWCAILFSRASCSALCLSSFVDWLLLYSLKVLEARNSLIHCNMAFHSRHVGVYWINAKSCVDIYNM